MRFRGDVHEAVGNRSADFSKLLWKGEGSTFKTAVEAKFLSDPLGDGQGKKNF